MTKKKILLLGGAYAQMPMIKQAKGQGYYVSICDYLPDNPGRKLADEYYNVSTTDREEVLKLARNIKPELVLAYASDPAVPVAAYVSEKLGLPGNRYESVRLLAEKDLFRKFLKNNGFETPEYVVINEKDRPEEIIKKMRFPIIIKPTDSSGSKGISKIENIQQTKNAVNYAMTFSRNKRIIAEEYIDNEIGDLHGDGFVINGKLIFSSLGDHIYNRKSNPFNPVGTLWPGSADNITLNHINEFVEQILKKIGYENGPVNIEARINSKGKLYIMEIGPRNGGHFVPQAIQHSTGFNMVKATLDLFSGKRVKFIKNPEKPSAYYAIHSDRDGKFCDLQIKNELKYHIKELYQYKNPGESVKQFHGANEAIGIIIMTFENREKMNYYIENINNYICLKVI